MNQIRKNQKGFTLIELLVVVIIVAVLAMVGVPLLQGNIQAARFTEADAGLGMIRTAMRGMQAQNGGFPVIAAGTAAVGSVNGLAAGDLTGRFFEDDDYVFPAITTTTLYCARVTGDTAGAAVRGNQVNGISRSMNQNGDLFNTADCTGTAIN